VPATWDETSVLDGKIGEHVVVARRSGEEWFVGAMTDAPRGRDPLGFLGGGAFDATIWADTPTPPPFPPGCRPPPFASTPGPPPGPSS
jgi:alpha-glucosidase